MLSKLGRSLILGVAVCMLLAMTGWCADVSFVDVYTPENLPPSGVLNGFSVFTDEDTVVTNDVNGSAIVFGNTASVKSKIDGDLLIFGNNVEFSGEVSGNLYVFGNNVTISGKVLKDIVTFGNLVTYTAGSQIERDLLSFGNGVTLQNTVGRNVHVACAQAEVSGVVGGDARIDAKKLTVSSGADVGGLLTYRAVEETDVPDNAKLGGVEYSKVEKPDQKPEKSVMGIVGDLVRALGSTFLIWLFITFLAPVFGKKSIYALGEKSPRTLLTGFLALVAIPVLSVLAMITVLGVGVGISLVVLYALALYLSFAIVSYALANVLVEKFGMKAFHKNVWYVLLTSLILKVITLIPFVGGVVGFFVILFGLGLILNFLFKKDQYGDSVIDSENINITVNYV